MKQDVIELATNVFAIVLVSALSMIVLAGAYRVAVWVLP